MKSNDTSNLIECNRIEFTLLVIFFLSFIAVTGIGAGNILVGRFRLLLLLFFFHSDWGDVFVDSFRLPLVQMPAIVSFRYFTNFFSLWFCLVLSFIFFLKSSYSMANFWTFLEFVLDSWIVTRRCCHLQVGREGRNPARAATASGSSSCRGSWNCRWLGIRRKAPFCSLANFRPTTTSSSPSPPTPHWNNSFIESIIKSFDCFERKH